MYPAGPLKLDDCHTHGPGSGAELFIVEGDSASNAVRRARDERFQAVLPLQGKPLNAVKASATKVNAYPFYSLLREALGLSDQGNDDLSRLRYERVLLLMDADADGIHCAALLMLYFHRWHPALLSGGHIGMVEAPIASVRRRNCAADLHARSDAEFHQACAKLRSQAETDFDAVRYRGLASMDAQVLAESCLVPTTRRVRAITVEDALAAMRVFGGIRPDGILRGLT